MGENTVVEYVASFAPTDLSDIQYIRVDREQADCVEKAMLLPDNQAKFEVTMLPVETAEQRQAAAEEWAGYKKADGNRETQVRGAILYVNGRDESPESMIRSLENKDKDETKIPYAPFVTHALAKIVKLDGTSPIRLFREYYNDSEL